MGARIRWQRSGEIGAVLEKDSFIVVSLLAGGFCRIMDDVVNGGDLMIMKKYYQSVQLYFFIGGIILFTYTLFFYFQNAELERSGTTKSYRVVDQNCKSYKGGSSIYVFYNNKTYKVGIAWRGCLAYPVGSEIRLIYNERFDYMYRPNGLTRDINRLIFSGLLLIISASPWKLLLSYVKRIKNRTG